MENESYAKYLTEGFEIYAILRGGHTYRELQKDYKTLSVSKKDSIDEAFFGHIDIEEAERFVGDRRIDTITEVIPIESMRKV